MHINYVVIRSAVLQMVHQIDTDKRATLTPAYVASTSIQLFCCVPRKLNSIVFSLLNFHITRILYV
jgi:hypothetical protein